MNRLEMYFRISGFNRLLYSEPAHWESSKFYQDEDFVGHLELWIFPITTRMALNEAKIQLLLTAQEFVLFHELHWGRRLALTEERPPLEPDDFENGVDVRISEVAHAVDKCDVNIFPGLPPKQMPKRPLSAERWIKTFAEAREFGGYADEQIKRYALIVEELTNEIPNLFASEGKARVAEVIDICARLKKLRDFVSHPYCHEPRLVAWIEARLPDAICDRPNKKKNGAMAKAVAFDRTKLTHTNLVGAFVPFAEALTSAIIRRKSESIATQETR